MNASLYPFAMTPDGEVIVMKGTWSAERRAQATACDLIDLRSEIEIMARQAPRWQVVTKPTAGSPSRALHDTDKVAYFDSLPEKPAEGTAPAAASTPDQRQLVEVPRALDEILEGVPRRWKYAGDPPALLPRPAAIHGDEGRAATSPTADPRSLDEIIMGVPRPLACEAVLTEIGDRRSLDDIIADYGRR